MDNTLISLQNWVIKDAGRLSFLFVERNCADIKRDIWVGCCTFLVLCELKNWGKYDCPLSWCTMGPETFLIVFKFSLMYDFTRKFIIQKCLNLTFTCFQSQFSMSTIIWIFLNKNFIDEYQFRRWHFLKIQFLKHLNF